MTDERFRYVMTSDEFTTGEKFICQAVWRAYMLGSFQAALWDLIAAADDDNLAKLQLGFPSEVIAARAWRHKRLRTRLEGVEVTA